MRARKFAELLGEPVVLDAGFEIAAQDLVRRQILHDDERLALVEVIDCGHAAGIARGLPRQRVIFEERALQRQRPAFADQPHIGQRLLDDDAAAARPRR